MGKHLNKNDLQLVQPNERLYTFVVPQMLSIGMLNQAMPRFSVPMVLFSIKIE